MKRSRKYRIFALTLLGATVALVSTVFLPTIHSARVVGMDGIMQGDGFLVQSVDHGSPAAVAGLDSGDLITAIDGRSIVDWWELGHTRLSQYLADRKSWDGRAVEIMVLSGGEPRTRELAVRPLHLLELGSYFFPRIAIIIVMIALTVFLLSSNPKDRTVLVVAICFFSFIWWVVFDRPNWPQFLSPLLMVYGQAEFFARELMVTLGMQVALGALIHVTLIFPRPLMPARTQRAVLPMVYILPSVILTGTLFYYTQGNLVDRLVTAYDVRIRLDTSLLIVAAVLLIVNSRRSRTRIQAEQVRWLMRAVIIFTALHVALWNLPKILTGVPLVPSYNWILVFLLLVPAALTVAVANHHLFGIRGLIRRRMRYLDAMASRRRNAVGRRDNTIQTLTEEIEQLREELDQYLTLEEGPANDSVASDRLQRFEEEYPAIREARHASLLGRSSLWVKVFEDAILASKGDTPVLIVGESGTGKTALARTIAVLSDRPRQRYREISCAQFEHADPAFALGKLFGIGKSHGLPNTLASGQPGLLEECDGGTLFLDDFDRLPLNAQDLLLYPLEGKAFEPGIGSGPSIRVSLKFIIATNRDVDQLVAQGRLQADVLARMGTRVFIPPLRERAEDTPLLVYHLLDQIRDELGHEIESVSLRAMKTFQEAEYRKGNVRELYSELRTAVGKASLEHDCVLRWEYLSDGLRGSGAGATAAGRAVHRARPDGEAEAAIEGAEPSLRVPDTPLELAVLRRNAFQIRPSEKELGLSHKSKTLSNHLRGRCIQALADEDWDIEIAARALAGIDDQETIMRIRRKMSRLLQSVERSVTEGTEQRLFNNLPAAYHPALQALIRRIARQ